ncbi:unnamed protein product [Cuscuta europaea]|uniref:Two-component response regulator n=1 Tax=Cuscuta europaea TaxID=41803 RepID=A0A9P0ZPU3_CUSEU|nr:unnamed protein product [Cuscuta europaea]
MTAGVGVSSSVGEEDFDDFPVGMRILAVDDDPICLKLLEHMLMKCQYRVTVTNQARVALKMLRENKDKFDLVISDVHMPDMDGFKLLELVGLEMDLPVIMLSANGDTRQVMKGVSHGACDYLVKPVRIEELRNIWQHVIRRKKFDSSKTHNCMSGGDPHCGSDQESGLGDDQLSACAAAADHNERIDNHNHNNNNKRRKEDQEEDESDDNGDEDSKQKKARVVWCIELHRKFVAAVNQLGIEKAVPKRILELMNVEGLTRENVASHLQKYRLYLKKTSLVPNLYANMAASFGGKDSSYNTRMSSLDGFRDFGALTGRYNHAAAISSSSSYTPGSLLGRLNTSAGVRLQNLNSLGLLQPNHPQPLGNSTLSPLGKFNSNPQNSIGSFLGIPSLELNQLQHSKFSTSVQDLNPFGSSRLVTSAVSSSTCTGSGPMNASILQGNSHQEKNKGGLGNSHSLRSDLLCTGASKQLGGNQLRWNYSSAGPRLQGSPLLSYSSTASASMPFEEDSRGQRPYHEGGFTGNQVPSLLWGERANNHSSIDALSNSVPANEDFMPFIINQGIDQNHDVFVRKMDTSVFGQSTNGGSSVLFQDSKLRSNEDSLLNSSKEQFSHPSQSYESWDDLVDAIIKQEQNGDIFDGEFGFGFDAHSFGS